MQRTLRLIAVGILLGPSWLAHAEADVEPSPHPNPPFVMGDPTGPVCARPTYPFQACQPGPAHPTGWCCALRPYHEPDCSGGGNPCEPPPVECADPLVEACRRSPAFPVGWCCPQGAPAICNGSLPDPCLDPPAGEWRVRTGATPNGASPYDGQPGDPTRALPDWVDSCLGPFDEGVEATSCAELPAPLERACSRLGLATVRRMCARGLREPSLDCALEPSEVECRACCEAAPDGARAAKACQRQCRDSSGSHQF